MNYIISSENHEGIINQDYLMGTVRSCFIMQSTRNNVLFLKLSVISTTIFLYRSSKPLLRKDVILFFGRRNNYLIITFLPYLHIHCMIV